MSKQSEIQISVIVPTYNKKEKITKCLDSVASSTLEPEAYEVICVDGSSLDGTRELLDCYGKIKNFNVLSGHKRANTLSMLKNKGLKQARGKYVFFMDSEDHIAEYVLSEALSTALRNNADMVCLPYWFADGDKMPKADAGKSVVISPYKDQGLIKSLLAVGKLVRGEMLKKWDITFPKHVTSKDDSLFAIKCFAASKNISTISASKKYYFLGSALNSDATRIQADPEHVAHMVAEAIHFIFSLPGSDLQSKIALCMFFLNRMHYLMGDHEGAIDYLHYHVGHYFEIFISNPHSRVDYFIEGVHRNSPILIKNSLAKLKGLSSEDIVAVDNGRIYMSVPLGNSSDHARVNVAYLNNISALLDKLAFDTQSMTLEFFVHKALLADYSPAIHLAVVERKNQKNHKKVACKASPDRAAKCQASFDLVELAVRFFGAVDFFVDVELNGYATRVGLEKANAFLSSSQNPPPIDYEGQEYVLSTGGKRAAFKVNQSKHKYLSLDINPLI